MIQHTASWDKSGATEQPQRIPFSRKLYPVPRTLVARIRAAAAEWYARPSVDLDAADGRGRS